MAKKTTSFRLDQLTLDKIAELSELLKESGGLIVERAIDRLYQDREAAVNEDMQERLKKVHQNKKAS